MKERSQEKQQGMRENKAHRKDGVSEDERGKWSRLGRGDGWKLQPFLQAELQLGIGLVLCSYTRLLGPVSRLYLYLWLCSLVSWGERVWMRAKKSTSSTLLSICPTDTSVCVCVWGVKAPCLHSCLGSGPSPCLLSPQARPVELGGTQWMSAGREGRWWWW